MFGCLVTLIAVAAVLVSFFYPVAAWLILLLPALFLLWMYATVRNQRWRHVPELSPKANEMLQKYGHFYSMPFGSRDFSSAASAVSLSGAAVGIIGAVKGFWWGLGLAAVSYVVMSLVAAKLNPSVFLRDPVEQAAHDEVLDYIASKQRRTP